MSHIENKSSIGNGFAILAGTVVVRGPKSHRVIDIAPDAGALADSSRLRSTNPSRSAFGRAALADKPDHLGFQP
jgi:hypothetical protein